MNTPRRWTARGRVSAVVAAVLLAAAAVSALAALDLIGERQRFVTWDGIGPDKWATVWLLRRHVDPDAEIVFRPPRSAIDGGIPFDVPEAELKRNASETAFERVMAAYGTDDPSIARLAAVINRIEIFGWQVRAFSDAAQVEEAYRQLQRRHGREQVPFGCYMAFFDRVHAVIADPARDLAASDPAELTPDVGCTLSGESGAPQPSLVAELSARAVLERMARGDKVVFLDTREDDEFAAGHIPGAINLKLREVSVASASELSDADLVVPYCVKDFRGYEVARALQKAGVENVAIMNPYGIQGWRGLGLPVTAGLDDDVASSRLAECVGDVEACLAS